MAENHLVQLILRFEHEVHLVKLHCLKPDPKKEMLLMHSLLLILFVAGFWLAVMIGFGGLGWKVGSMIGFVKTCYATTTTVNETI